MAKRFVLAIDGGGVRGIVAATLLDALEGERQRIGNHKPLADCFDLIAGTSTGAIIAAGLAAPNERGDGPRSAPAALRDLYRQRAREIFPSRFWCRMPVLGRLRQFFGPLYDNERLKKVVREEIGDIDYEALRGNLFIGAYAIDPRGAAIFRGGPAYVDHLASHTPDPDLNPISRKVSVVDAVVGSAAAPTYFPPYQIIDRERNVTTTVVDGGLFLNDPALAAFTDAATLYPSDEIHVISIGSGRLIDPYPFEQARNWGFLQWLSPLGPFRTPLISAIGDGQARAVHNQLKKLLGPRYHRFDYDLESGYGSPNLDDASKRNMRLLEQGALKMAEEMRPRLKALAELIG